MRQGDSTVLVVAGLPAAGKSTFAGCLARALPGAVIVDKDQITGPLVQAALAAAGQPLDLDGDYYKRWLSPASYEATIAVAKAVIDSGATPIVVAPYERALHDPGWHDALRRHLGADRLLVVWMVASAPTLRDRMLQRGEDRDHSKLEAWENWVTRLPISQQPPWPHVLLDTSNRTQQDLDRDARDFLRRLADARRG